MNRVWARDLALSGFLDSCLSGSQSVDVTLIKQQDYNRELSLGNWGPWRGLGWLGACCTLLEPNRNHHSAAKWLKVVFQDSVVSVRSVTVPSPFGYPSSRLARTLATSARLAPSQPPKLA